MQTPHPKEPAQDPHLRRALDHAQRLSDSRVAGAAATTWAAHAAQVGDLSVLALSLRD